MEVQMQYFTDGGNKLIRVHFDGAVDDLDSMHAFADAKAESWAVRDGWQPAPTATGDIVQSGWLDRIAEGKVPVEQARMRAEASA
jgi:hypothetical protein